MASLLNQGMKDLVRGVFNDLHDTFAKEITVFKINQQVSISSNPDFNAFYGSSFSQESTEVSQTFLARIKFINVQEEVFSERDGVSSNNAQNKIILPAGSVRLKITSACWDYVKDAKRIEFNGVRYNIISNGQPIGPFDYDYYTIYLSPVSE